MTKEKDILNKGLASVEDPSEPNGKTFKFLELPGGEYLTKSLNDSVVQTNERSTTSIHTTYPSCLFFLLHSHDRYQFSPIDSQLSGSLTCLLFFQNCETVSTNSPQPYPATSSPRHGPITTGLVDGVWL